MRNDTPHSRKAGLTVTVPMKPKALLCFLHVYTVPVQTEAALIGQLQWPDQAPPTILHHLRCKFYFLGLSS